MCVRPGRDNFCPLQPEGISETEEARGQVPGGAGQGQAEPTLRALRHLREEQSHSHEVEQACQVRAGVRRTSPWWCWARSS